MVNTTRRFPMFRVLVLPFLFLSLAACQMTLPAPVGTVPVATLGQASGGTEEPQQASAGTPLALTTFSSPNTTGFEEFSETPSHPSLSGIWRVAGGASNDCTIRFDEIAQTFASASILGCPSSPLTGISAWNIAGDQIRLLSGDGQALALLYVDRPDLLTGYTADGQDLVLSR